jgi:glycosyltransferase involved in cell wall biosynthesis
MRVLLLANDCNPDWPSLPVVGYNACRGIAERVDVVVATHVRNKPNIDRKGLGRAEVVYLDNEYVASPMYKVATWLRGGSSVGWTTNIAMQYPPYVAYEWEAWKRFKRQLKAGEFDLVHRVTPMSPTLPSPMAKWCKRIGVPFVLGPLNGGLRWPPEFTGELKKEKEWLTYLRDAYRLLPYASATYSKSSAILAAFQHTIDRLPPRARDRIIDFPEVGIDPTLFEAPAERPVRDCVTFLYAGRLVPYKCPDVAVSAFAANPNLRKHKLIVAGDGPEMPRLREIVRQNQLESCVELLGRRTQAEVGQLMRSADVFTFPSIRELGAGVVVEAMGCALPCIVVDYGGPGGLIHSESGVKVSLGDKQHLIDRFAAEMESLANDPDRRRRFGERAHRDAMQIYSWTNKGRKTVEVYEWVLGRRADRPDFYSVAEAPADLAAMA